MQQLTIYDAIAATPLNVGDSVRVIPSTDESDVETYYYLQDFTKAKGEVLEVLPKMQYRARFGNRVGIFKNEELRKV